MVLKKMHIVFSCIVIFITVTACTVTIKDSYDKKHKKELFVYEDKYDSKLLIESIELKFQLSQNVNLEIINEDEIDIDKEIVVDEYTLYVYKKDEMTNYFIGIQISDSIFEIGEIAYQLDMVNVDTIIVEGIEFITTAGTLGAAYPIEYYITVKEQLPIMYINQELPIYIADIDNDKTLEWISQYDGQVTIYKMINGEWSFIRLYDITDDYIYFKPEDNIFSIVRNRGMENQRIDKYKLKGNRLVLM